MNGSSYYRRKVNAPEYPEICMVIDRGGRVIAKNTAADSDAKIILLLPYGQTIKTELYEQPRRGRESR